MNGNFIEANHSRAVLHLEKSAAEKLNRIEPKGCPFDDYTFLDLLKDYVWQYDWLVQGKMSVIDFINMISYKSYNAYVYGKTIIEVIQEA